MIRCDHERLVAGDVLETGHADPEQQPHQRAQEREDRGADAAHRKARQPHVGRGGRGCRGGRRRTGGHELGRRDLVDQITHREDSANGLARERDAEALLDLGGERDPLERIDLQLELRTRVERDALVGVTRDEPLPRCAAALAREQLCVLAGRLAAAGGLGVGGRGTLVELGKQVPAKLAELGTWQRRTSDAERRDALIRRQARADLLEILAQQRRLAQGAALANRALVRNDQSDEPTVVFEDRDFLEQARARVLFLDRLREDLLAVGEHEQLLASADDTQEALTVEPAEIAGPEEAVARERVGRRLWIAAIAREYGRAARDDLALDPIVRRRRRVLVARALDRPNGELDARQRPALGTDSGVRAIVERENRRSLREAVAREHRPPEALETPGELGIELRSPAADEIERLAELSCTGRNKRLPIRAPVVRRTAMLRRSIRKKSFFARSPRCSTAERTLSQSASQSRGTASSAVALAARAAPVISGPEMPAGNTTAARLSSAVTRPTVNGYV